MKTNKALKRLAKIEALTSDVTRRFSAGAPHIREVLKDLKAAVDRVKEALSVQASSEAAKKKSVPAGQKAAAKKAAVKATKGKTAKKKGRIKRAAKKATAKKAAAKQTAPTRAREAEDVAPEPTPGD